MGNVDYVVCPGYSHEDNTYCDCSREGWGDCQLHHNDYCRCAEARSPKCCGNAAANDDCYEPRPEYCAQNVHLCKVPGFLDFMKKMCPRHCGYCNQEDATSPPTECVEPDPAYCAMHAFRCHQAGFEEIMKRKCPRTCGYCYYENSMKKNNVDYVVCPGYSHDDGTYCDCSREGWG